MKATEEERDLKRENKKKKRVGKKEIGVAGIIKRKRKWVVLEENECNRKRLR